MPLGSPRKAKSRGNANNTVEVGADLLRETLENDERLLSIFEREMQEIYTLSSGCFSRFKSTALFRDWKPEAVEP